MLQQAKANSSNGIKEFTVEKGLDYSFEIHILKIDEKRKVVSGYTSDPNKTFTNIYNDSCEISDTIYAKKKAGDIIPAGTPHPKQCTHFLK
jgi:hypothetical protein